MRGDLIRILNLMPDQPKCSYRDIFMVVVKSNSYFSLYYKDANKVKKDDLSALDLNANLIEKFRTREITVSILTINKNPIKNKF
jgi:hypothetical protein